ncbi:MAG: polysaccharide deacetylase family protein [Desulfovibrionaceae bacterium]|nr:polysaccharide deacetylase family protein [Desulfovibrionaceae bacterium]
MPLAFERTILLLVFMGTLCAAGCQTLNVTREEAGVPEGVVIFSFDDGPNAHAGSTARLLDVLRRHEIRAFFVLLGENVRQAPELVRRMRAEGHYLANHGYRDKFAIFMDEEEFCANLDRGEAAIFEALDGDWSGPRFYRPHGGFYSPVQAGLWRVSGYRLLPASLRFYDAALGEADRDKLVREVVTELEKRGGGLILLHDARGAHGHAAKETARTPGGPFNRGWLPEAVEEIIRAAQDRGFVFGGPEAAAFGEH